MTIKATIDQLVTTAGLVYSWAFGSSTTSVTFGSYTVRSPAKLIADADATIQSYITSLVAGVNAAAASALTATTKAAEAAASAAAASAVVLSNEPVAPSIAPAFVFDFANARALDGRITFSRASGATRINQLGVIELVAANVPRFDFNPLTLACRGLLTEEARTNLFLNSLIDGTDLATQSVTVTAQAYTISFYGAGSITLSGAATATITGTGAYPTRTSYTFTPSAGTLTCTVSGAVKWAQCEAGTGASSFIPTAGLSAARLADVVTSFSGALSSVFNGSEGTMLGVGEFGVSTRYLFHVDDGTANNRYILGAAGNGAIEGWAITGGATQAQLSFGTATSGTIMRLAMAYKANDVAGSYNGATVLTDTSATLPAVTTMRVSANQSATFGSGWTSYLAYFPKRLSNAELQALTA